MIVLSPLVTIFDYTPPPQPSSLPTPINVLDGTDLDQSGTMYHQIQVGLGPSLGTVIERVKPQIKITAGKAFRIINASVILMANNEPTLIFLPDVRTWVTQPAYHPATEFERSIWIKDYLGVAVTKGIQIEPVPGQFINGISQFIIETAFGVARIYPLNDLTGWYTV